MVKTRLKHLLLQSIDRIHARKCKVSIISSKVARDFCKVNHIQGPGQTKIAYGLFYRDELVSIMTFALPSISKGSHNRSPGQWELTRFCTKENTVVVGGGSKLFSAFISDQSPQQVISYSDLRWNTGTVYSKLGFTYMSRSSPNYWYFKLPTLDRFHRFAFRKNKTDDPDKTEWENRQLQGYNRIWDCGNDKWMWSKK